MKDIWLLPLPPKMKVFLWKVLQHALPLGENLEKRGIATANAPCVFCGDRETANHMFLSCPFAQLVWNSAPITNTQSILDGGDFKVALQKSRLALNLPPTRMIFGSLFPWVCWNIWLARNHKFFQNRSFEGTDVVAKAVIDAQEWQAAQVQAPITHLSPPFNDSGDPRNLITDPDLITIHTDAAWRASSNKAGLAWIMADSSGYTVAQGSMTEDYVPSPLVAEGLAIREALLQAQARGFSKILFKFDAQTLVRAISERDSIKELSGILQDIHNLSCDLSFICFSFISRKDNMSADSLAKRALASFSAM